MDYKEKYEQALERARIWKEKSGMPNDRQGILDDIFPELCESEDEKIRKAIIAYIKDDIEELTYEAEIEELKKYLAWLEKQGEQKTTWTKEDDVRLQACIDCLQAESLMGKVDTVMTKWLESLKQRIVGG